MLERTEEEEEKSEDKEEKPFVLGEDKKNEEKDTPTTGEEGKPLDLPISKEQMELQKKAKEYLAAKNGNIDDVSETPIDPTISEVVEEAKKKGRKRKRTKEFDDDSSEESSEEEGEDDMPPGMDKKNNRRREQM